MKTYQIGGNGVDDFGHSYKVAPMTTEEFTNVMHCFVIDGGSENPVKPQAVLPDVSAFNVSLLGFLLVKLCCWFALEAISL